MAERISIATGKNLHQSQLEAKCLYLGVNSQAKRASISNLHNVGFQVNPVTASLTPSADRLGVRAVFLDERLSKQFGITI